MIKTRMVALLCFATPFAGCASSTPFDERPAAGTAEMDCRHLEVGPVRIRYDARLDVNRRLRAMGYDGWDDVRMDREIYQDSLGRTQERILAYEGIAWRYADPACRTRT